MEISEAECWEGISGDRAGALTKGAWLYVSYGAEIVDRAREVGAEEVLELLCVMTLLRDGFGASGVLAEYFGVVDVLSVDGAGLEAKVSESGWVGA